MIKLPELTPEKIIELKTGIQEMQKMFQGQKPEQNAKDLAILYCLAHEQISILEQNFSREDVLEIKSFWNDLNKSLRNDRF